MIFDLQSTFKFVFFLYTKSKQSYHKIFKCGTWKNDIKLQLIYLFTKVNKVIMTYSKVVLGKNIKIKIYKHLIDSFTKFINHRKQHYL